MFDAHGVSFVSVTQAFNTATSMGRLTLTCCCRSPSSSGRSLASASATRSPPPRRRACGWAAPPLGYDVKDRKLVVNEAEAETVRYIFERYLELGSVRLLGDSMQPASSASVAGA